MMAALNLSAQDCDPPMASFAYTPDGGQTSNRLLADFQPRDEDQGDFDGDELAYAMSASGKQVGPAICVSIQNNGKYGFNGIVINRTNDCYQPLPFGGQRIIDLDPDCPNRSSELALQLADQTGQGNFEGYFFVVYDPDVDNFFVVSAPDGSAFNGTDDNGLGGSVDNLPIDPTDPDASATEQDIPDTGTSTPPSDNTSTLNDGALPVEFAYFSGQYDDKRVLLSWLTTTESDNDYFDVQRANLVTGTFETIGQVDGAGSAEEVNKYVFEDRNYGVGENLYRLIQTDFDGTSTLSEVISVRVLSGSDIGLSLEAFPNPASDMINLRTAGLTGETARVELFASTGRLIRTLIVGSASAQLEVSDLPAGVYQLRLIDGVKQVATRVVVQ